MNAGLQGRDGGITIDRERCRGCGACVEFCPAEALELHGRAIPVDTLFEQLCRDTAFYAASGGGVTLSGGEPLAQPEAAIALLRMLGKAGVHTALDTCGAVAARSLADALEFAGLVLFDVKTLDLAKHEAFTGVPFARVDTAARIVNASETPVWVRTPVIPGYTDDEQTVRAIAQYVRDTFRFCERYDLLAYSNLCAAKYEQLGRRFPLAGTPPITAEHMERLAEAARAEGAPNVQWSGPTRVEAA
jgi:pyruvate formate lyase activating enzyme